MTLSRNSKRARLEFLETEFRHFLNGKERQELTVSTLSSGLRT
jgi:hypothetical protein